jgi:trigger factor
VPYLPGDEPRSTADVKTDVEELSPTRVRLTIEVPFEELKPNLDQAYREVARQVRVPGFRPGRIPPRVIDQRVGRGAVLEQAVNEAVPQLYGKALEEHEVYALGQPDLEITKLDDGKELTFTAEVDVRPKFDIPDLDGMPVTVDDADVTPDQVEEYLGALRERFASLKSAGRPAGQGDYVSIDLSAVVDGQPVDDAQASGISYEVGSGSMLEGLDEALLEMAEGDTKTFTAELAGGNFAGMQADVTVTVHSVKVKELPELDDEFAQSASEFDTLGELRAGARSQLQVMRQAAQAEQARERALEAALSRIDIPLPDSLVEQEIELRRQSLADRLDRAGADRESYLEAAGLTEEELEAEFDKDARQSVKAGFLLDKLAAAEELGVDQAELTGYVAERAYRLGVPPDQLARQLADRGQVGAAVADVLRGKSLSLIAERAAITDASGRSVDLAAAAAPAEAAAADAEPDADPGSEAEPEADAAPGAEVTGEGPEA